MKIVFHFLLFFLITSVTKAQQPSPLFNDTQVAEVRITVDAEDLIWVYENPESDSLHMATISFTNALINETVDSVGFRLRGNTSRQAYKKSLKISFNTFRSGAEFYGVDKLNLNGEHNDPSIIRSKLCWDLFNEIGVIASRAAHAAVYINDVYYGLYILVEHIDDEFLTSRFTDDTGNLWKCLYPADLTYRGENGEDYYPYSGEDRPYDLRTNETGNDFTQLARLIGIINNTPPALLADSLEQVLDVPGLIKYLAINVLTGSWDDYRFLSNNYYLYHEPAVNRFHWIPYDYDNSFGVDWFAIDWATIDLYNYPAFNDEPRPLVVNLLANARYHDLYSHFLKFYSDNVLSLPLWESRIDALKEKITPWAEADTFRILDYGFTIDDFHNSFSAQSYSNQHVQRGLKEFMVARTAAVEEQLVWLDAGPLIYDLHWSPQFPEASDSIAVQASVFSSAGVQEVQVRYRPEEQPAGIIYAMEFSPLAGRSYVEDADRWSGSIPPLGPGARGSFIIEALDSLGNIDSYPRNGGVPLQAPGIDSSGLVINEFLASNDSVNMDAAGEYDDWVEIYNTGPGELALVGKFLTDNPGIRDKWQFPPESPVLGEGDFLLVWCDDDSGQAGLHTSFRLDADGEFIALVAEDGRTIIDSLSFTLQSTDVSLGRFPDGGSQWQALATPTPGTTNTVTAIDQINSPPRQFFLLQNYPNPFNPQTRIEFKMDTRRPVSLKIYNTAGQLVDVLVNKTLNGGRHTYLWNAKDLASGIYLYSLRSGSDVSVKKMILIK